MTAQPTAIVRADHIQVGDRVTSIRTDFDHAFDFSARPLEVVSAESDADSKVVLKFDGAGDLILTLPSWNGVERLVTVSAWYFFQNHPVQKTHLVGPDSQLWKNATTIVTEQGVVVKTTMGDMDA